MADSIQVRRVNVELLRPGPPQNQLLSPLTQYLGVCGDAGAGIVHVPYEHATFERKLKELRYETGDAGDRLAVLSDLGADMGRILGTVPGLPGSLGIDPGQPGALVHLRLTLSASELALLPFEFAKGPVGPNGTTESWLAIQTRPPVCMTRHIRTVSSEGVCWPARPRVLFVAGDPDAIPFEAHRDALLAAIRPFRYPGRDDAVKAQDGAREQHGELLTILVDASLADVVRECRDTSYTHVHVLTHGGVDDTAYQAFGLVLRGASGEDDVVSGERFASALTSFADGAIHRPAVVTVASCDSGNVGSVMRPGASFAHALHQAGIALAVASQFPLSMDASVSLVEALYGGLLWGAHPLPLLQQSRTELHARYTSRWHDWASLVVYEALPISLDEQLDRLRYSQSRRALDAALERIDRIARQPIDPDDRDSHAALVQLDADVDRALDRLPLSGAFEVECLGLRASARKRLAQAIFMLGASPSGASAAWRDDAYELLDQAWQDYDRALRALVVNDGRPTQRIASLHWLMVQRESLSAVLARERDPGHWAAARLCADLYAGHAEIEERAWAQGSLAELWLLRLADPAVAGDAVRRREAEDQATAHAAELLRAYPGRSAFPVVSTRRQFARYVDWWGDGRFVADLAAHGGGRAGDWKELVGTARRIAELLQPLPSKQRASGGDAPATAPASVAVRAPPAAGEHARTATPPPDDAPASATGGKLASAARKRRSAFFDIEMLPAGHGDCLWIEYGDASATHRVLIDCGTQPSASGLLERIAALPDKDRRFELLALSHIDSDHIGGALPLLKSMRNGLAVGDVWFNGWRHLSQQLGSKQGEMFSSAIVDMKLPWNAWRDGRAIVADPADLPVCKLPGGMTLTLLSPTKAQLDKLAPAWVQELKSAGLVPGAHADYSRFLKEKPSTSTDIDSLADTAFNSDTAPANGSSIAFLAEFGGASAIFGADAHDPVLVASIRALLEKRGIAKLKLDAYKVPHHASQNNLSSDLLRLIDCKRYCVSTNGDYFHHPDREAIGRIIKYGGARPTLYFNYRTRYNDVWAQPALQERYAYSAVYRRDEDPGSLVSLLAARR